MRPVRRGSLLRFVVMTALAASLSPGLAKAQSFRAQSRLGPTAGGVTATLSAWNYFSMSKALGLSPTYHPPEPCSPWEWVKGLLGKVGLLL